MDLEVQENKTTWVVFKCTKCGFVQIKKYDKLIKNCCNLPPICCRLCFGRCEPNHIDSILKK